jgi:translocation and assembly module TamA
MAGRALHIVGVAAVCLGAALSCGGQQKRSAPVIGGLDIEGNDALSDRRIRKKLLSEKTPWWPFAKKNYFDPVVWQTDLKRIERLYQSHGYFQAQVVRDQVAPDPPDGVDLTAEVREGPRTLVGALELKGLEGLPPDDREAALGKSPLEVGDPFVEEKWHEATSELRERLRGRGYARAEVLGEARVDVDTQRAALRIEARPGRRFRFGEIQVSSNEGKAIPAAWIWEEVRLAISEGEPYSPAALLDARRRLTAMGVFAMVEVTEGEPREGSDLLPVVVNTREAPLHTLRLGGGLRIDQIRNEARLLSEWINRNFKGGMRRLTARVEVGWAFLPNIYSVFQGEPSEARRNGPVLRSYVEFEQPRFLRRPTLRERSLLEVARTMEQAYDVLGARLINGVIWRPTTSFTLYPSYHLETYLLDGAANTGVVSAPLALGCHTTDQQCWIWLSYIEEVLTLDRRDNLLEPREGWYASLSLQQGGGPLQGDYTFLRVLPELRGYATFGSDRGITLAARARVGELLPSSGNPDDTAVVTRFYTGGAFSMRGFNERRLSPLLLVTPLPTDSNPNPNSYSVPVGGNGLVDGSFELRYELSGNLVGAAFVDFGQVTRDRMRLSDLKSTLVAVGIGLRYRTPVGPVRVDVGVRLPVGKLPPLLVQDANGVITQVPYAQNKSCFGVGGSSGDFVVGDGLCVLHISIGEAF